MKDFTELSRARTLLDLLEEYFSVFDTQNPSESNRTDYASHCGEIYALIDSIKKAIDSAMEE